MTGLILLDTFLRGAAAGVLLLVTALSFRSARAVRLESLAALFFAATAVYAIVSSPILAEALGAFRPPFVLLATLNSVFFWWFASALFDDDFRWRAWRFIPFALMLGFFLLRLLAPDWTRGPADIWLQQIVIIAMLGHALWLALAHRKDDLIEKRRAFRLVFVALAGFLGLAIAAGEVLLGDAPPAPSLMVVHAAALFALSIGLAAWVLPPVRLFIESAQPAPPPESPPSDEDAVHLARLNALMKTGLWRAEGFGLSDLAAKLGLPEYRVRRLINGALGFRNFPAFLNAWRVEDAKAVLADPAQAGRQITQIALDLGYGSLGPFNRAFKAETSQTPTEFRKSALATALQRS